MAQVPAFGGKSYSVRKNYNLQSKSYRRVIGRYTVRRVRSTIRVAAMLVALAAIAGCIARSPAHERIAAESEYTISVVDHGWHTAIVVRRSDVDQTVWPEVNDFREATFVEVAWGDRDFYMADRATAWLAIKAALFTSGSVLHIAGFSSPVATTFPGDEAVDLRISRRGLNGMTRFFHDEYQRAEKTQPVPLAPGLYGAGRFYAARSRYHLFNTCNTWVLRALRAAGFDVTPAGAVTAGDVMREARRARPLR